MHCCLRHGVPLRFAVLFKPYLKLPFCTFSDRCYLWFIWYLLLFVFFKLFSPFCAFITNYKLYPSFYTTMPGGQCMVLPVIHFSPLPLYVSASSTSFTPISIFNIFRFVEGWHSVNLITIVQIPSPVCMSILNQNIGRYRFCSTLKRYRPPCF